MHHVRAVVDPALRLDLAAVRVRGRAIAVDCGRHLTSRIRGDHSSAGDALKGNLYIQVVELGWPIVLEEEFVILGGVVIAVLDSVPAAIFQGIGRDVTECH